MFDIGVVLNIYMVGCLEDGDADMLMRDDGTKSRLRGSKEVGRWKRLLHITKVYIPDLLYIEDLESI